MTENGRKPTNGQYITLRAALGLFGVTYGLLFGLVMWAVQGGHQDKTELQDWASVKLSENDAKTSEKINSARKTMIDQYNLIRSENVVNNTASQDQIAALRESMARVSQRLDSFIGAQTEMNARFSTMHRAELNRIWVQLQDRRPQERP